MLNSTTLRFIIILFLLLPFFGHSQRLTVDTSNLVNGNGIAFFISNAGKTHGFATYVNNSLSGKLYIIDTLEQYAIVGEMKCDSTCFEYIPGFKIKYRTLEKPDTVTLTLDTLLFRNLFEYTTSTVFSKEPSIIFKDIYSVHPELQMIFGYSASIPVGKWQRIDLKEKYVFTDIFLDDCGNPIVTRYYNPDGSILNELKWPPPNKRMRAW